MKRILSRLAHQVESGFDSRREEARGEESGPFRIAPYRTFGTPTRLHLRGRVLRGSLRERVEQSGALRNLRDSVAMLRSDEVANARLEISIDGRTFAFVTDEEGYFHFTVESSFTEGWREIPLRLISPGSATATAEVLVPPADARFGVISDLDDTVVQTGATKLTTMLRATLLQSAHSRTPFEGVPQFYRHLHAGHNPLFYVSSGPWNFYDVYAEFLELQGIPRGPILLGDFGFDEETFIHRPHLDHKLRSIRSILDEYPDLDFVLIGDSGQQDPEVYRAVVSEYPGRIRAIYIRDVSVDERDRVVVEMGEALRLQSIDLVFVAETAKAEEHARAAGLIQSAE